MTFGEYLREKRVQLEPSLRRFCDRYGFDPGFFSRMERNLIPPPQSKEKLHELARILKISTRSPEFQRFFVLAEEGVEAFHLESFFHNISDKKLIHKLPTLLRKLDNPRLTEQKLNELIEIASR